MVILILVRRIQRYVGPVEATHKNLGDKYQNWISLNNMGASNMARVLLRLIPRLWVQFIE